MDSLSGEVEVNDTAADGAISVEPVGGTITGRDPGREKSWVVAIRGMGC